MTNPQSTARFIKALVSGLLLVSPTSQLWALNAKNAGPEVVELRFKLPPPPTLTPDEELASFKIMPGFHAELVAAEPMIDSPISVCWDAKGRMFVCEMRGYMHDIEGTGEEQPTGRIVMLEDTDGDGKMDKRTVFVDNLVLPRAIMCVNGGLLVGEPPNLWFLKDTNGDGVADVKELVDDSYGTAGGQPEHMANSPTWALDNWIYSANHSKRYRLKDGKFITEPSGQRGQWGLTQDNFGRLYFNSNSDLLRSNLVPEALGKRNPNATSLASLGVQVMKDQSTWPAHLTPGVNRGYDPKELREDGTLRKCTATCGPVIYRGALFPQEFQGNAFIPEPAGNLVKRLILREKDGSVSASNATENSEFWTSTDERFRPVNALTGPDGALYIVDMYRGVIQHKFFLTHYLIANIKDRNLETPCTQGRIWRLVPDKATPAPVVLPEEPAKLVDFLAHKDGWVRDTAQRLLIERKDTSVLPALNALADAGKTSLARIHALWTLEGLGALTPELLTAKFKDSEPKVRAVAVRLVSRPQLNELEKLITDASVDVQIALAFQLSPFPESQQAALELALKAGGQPLVRDAILSGLRGRELEFLQALIAADSKNTSLPLVEMLAQSVLKERRKDRVQKLLELMAAQTANSPLQLALLAGSSDKLTPPPVSAADKALEARLLAETAAIEKTTPTKATAEAKSTSQSASIAANTTGNAQKKSQLGTSPAKKDAPKAKLLYLETEPAELEKLAAIANAKAKPLVAALNARLAWPGKPGVPPPPVIKPLTPDEQVVFETGKVLYTSICAGCHQPTGTGMEGLAPALVDSEWVMGSPDIVAKVLLHGLSGPIRVGGITTNLEMPPLGAALTDEQIAAALTYVRREWENTGSPVTAGAVAKVRRENAARTSSWTDKELHPPAAKKVEAAAN